MMIVVSFFAVAELGFWIAGMPTLTELEDPFRGLSGLVAVFEADDHSFLVSKPVSLRRLRGICKRSLFVADELQHLDTTVVCEHCVFTTKEMQETGGEFQWRLDRLMRRAQAVGVKVVLATKLFNERLEPVAVGHAQIVLRQQSRP